MKIKIWQIIVTVISLVFGTLLHFTYEWSGQNMLVGILSSINESTWEHLKLVFYPILLMAIIGYFIIGKRNDNYWLAQAIGILIAMTFITVLFYTYTGAIGINSGILNIVIFIVAVILGQYIVYKILISHESYNAEIISIIFLILLFLLFIIYTFNPPQIPLFKDPLSNTYGINNIV